MAKAAGLGDSPSPALASPLAGILPAHGCGRYSVAVVPQRIAAVHGPNPHDRHSLAGGSLKRSLGMVLRGAGTSLPPTAKHPPGLRP